MGEGSVGSKVCSDIKEDEGEVGGGWKAESRSRRMGYGQKIKAAGRDHLSHNFTAVCQWTEAPRT